MKAMAKEPDDRPQSMEALEKELQNVAMGCDVLRLRRSRRWREPDPTPPPQFGMLGALRGAAQRRALPIAFAAGTARRS